VSTIGLLGLAVYAAVSGLGTPTERLLVWLMFCGMGGLLSAFLLEIAIWLRIYDRIYKPA
jgi:hypothetical protein